MNPSWIALLAAPALVAPLAPKFTTVTPDPFAGDRLVRVADEDKFDASDSRHKLSSDDLDVREREFDRLADLARRDDKVRATIEEWSRSKDRTDLAWTSRLILRQAQPAPRAAGTDPFMGGPRRDPAIDDIRRRFEELQGRFGGIDSMFEDLERQLGNMQSTPPAPPQGARPRSGSSKHESQSYSMQITPDGVKIDVDEDVDGQRKTQTFTGKSLEEILAAHPELRDRIGDAPRIEMHGFGNAQGGIFGPGGTWPGLAPKSDDSTLLPARPLDKSGVRTDILGVVYSEPSADERKQAGIEGDVGIKVERVEKGTIAAALGVQKGDVLVALNGRDLHGAADVQQTLRERKAGDDVRLELVDAKGKRRTLTWKAGDGDVQRF